MSHVDNVFLAIYEFQVLRSASMFDHIHITIAQHQKTSSTRHVGSSSRQPARPTIGSQVVIQSEQEKQLKKIHRREDRRLARQQAKGEGPQQSEDHLMDFDPEYLRKVRYVH